MPGANSDDQDLMSSLHLWVLRADQSPCPLCRVMGAAGEHDPPTSLDGHVRDTLWVELATQGHRGRSTYVALATAHGGAVDEQKVHMVTLTNHDPP